MEHGSVLVWHVCLCRNLQVEEFLTISCQNLKKKHQGAAEGGRGGGAAPPD
jgi:hypothetical protein